MEGGFPVNKTIFGVLPSGETVERYTLTDGSLECEVLTYAGTLRALRVPGRDGRKVDVLLGYDTLEDYLGKSKVMGALVGRCANRIGGASFDLNGVHYPLTVNNRGVHIHSGQTGFHKQNWTVEAAGDDFLTLSLVSPDGQEGYPGTLTVQVTYRLGRGGLLLDYTARSDRDTICNLTNHAYFNLSGHDSGPVYDQELQMFADHYTPTDDRSIPTGEIAPVDGTPLDLRVPTRLGDRIADGGTQPGGYDHNLVVRGEPGTLRPAARVYSGATGIVMEALTTQPGVQLYTANGMNNDPPGKDGAVYTGCGGFCLETQAFPDSPNHPEFPSVVLRAGETYHHTTVYRFSVD